MPKNDPSLTSFKIEVEHRFTRLEVISWLNMGLSTFIAGVFVKLLFHL